MSPDQPAAPPDAEPGDVPVLGPFTVEIPEDASDAALLAWLGTDAVRWARAFMHALGMDEDDDSLGTLIGWFANAIETGRDAGRGDVAAAIDLVRTMDALGLKVTRDLGAAHQALVALNEGQKRVVIVHRTVDADKLAKEILDQVTARQADR